MIVRLYVRMFYVLVLCPVLLASAVLTLTIDSQLGTSVEDCFERVSIGEQLPRDSTYRNVTELTTTECEQICRQDKKCQAYDYGVGAKGNATCDLSNLDEKEIKEKNLFLRNPDYDVYVRRFQCEQSPPTPIVQEFNGPESEAAHRPVFRPGDEDAKRPLSDDLNPYETNRPSYVSNRPNRPNYGHFNERPDDYNTGRPDNDRPPSYGVHKPQEVPYRPERPYINTTGPDSYDQLYFQGPYDRPRPGALRPDPYRPPLPGDEIQDIYGPKPNRPQRPEFVPEKPQYQYIIRPNKRPSRPEDQGYNQVKPIYETRPDPYGQNSGLHSGPVRPPERPYQPPRPYQPSRPYDKPNYSYTEQYASNYGTSQDNSITVQIYDPPRPYRPNINNERPYHGSSGTDGVYGQGYGYNSFSNQQSYSQSASQYGSNSFSQSYQNNYRPQQPSYGSNSYGQNENENVGYGTKPAQRPKPSHTSDLYGNQHSQSGYNQGYGSQNSYGSQSTSSNQEYGSQNSYGSQSSLSNQGHGSQNSYGGQSSSSNQGYGNQNSYGGQSSSSNQGYGNQNSYGGQTSSSNQGYESHNSYGGQTSSSSQGYGSQSSSNNQGYGQNSYGSQSSTINQNYGQNNYGSHSSTNNQGYGQNSYGGQSSSNNQGNENQYHYGSQSSSSYGSQTSNALHESHGSQYGSTQIGYGGSISDTSNTQTGYGSPMTGSPSNNQYGNQQSSNSYSDNESGYRNPASNSYGDRQSSKYGSRDDNNKNSHYYGSNYGDRFDYNQNGYYGSHLGYGTHDLYGIKPGSYGKDPNQQYRPIITNKGPYGENHTPNDKYPSYANQDTRPNSSQYDPSGYGADVKNPDYKSKNKQDQPTAGHAISRLDVKPVYEQEAGKPKGDLVTTRPVAVSGSGRDPKPDVSYEACFRRVLAGRRALRSHVRKVVNCERLEDCRRECAEERRFHCESFNYRLDPTFRGKGLCELMTKPIEAFDLQQDFVEDKDYDFYELDRNSLEPYCPETLRGPGLLHSGYLSSKPAQVPGHDNQWRDRMDWSEKGYKSYNRFFDERRTDTYNRRYEDQLYVPYQIGVVKDNDDRENWGQYGGNYGGIHSYYKNSDDYHKSKNHWGISESAYHTYHGVRHHNDKIDFNYHSLQKNPEWEDYGYGYGSWKRGRWNSSGTFWKEHGVDTSYNKKPVYHDFESRSDDTTKDCSSRRRPGMSLGSGAIRRSSQARTVVECEAACFNEREFKCVSYSYRYSSTPGSDNCFLSERPYRGLEMSTDSGSDVYAMPLHQDCLTISTKPWVESECFWHVRSGAAVSGKAVRAALTVTGLGACEAECIRAHSFFCRGFSFRFDAPTIGDDLENCLLTSSPPTSLEQNHGLRPNKHELYSRGNYGRGCEPALYDDVNREPQCYLQYESAAKLTPISIRGRAQAKDERACGDACTEAPFKCLSFSFNNNAHPDAENCLLSEIRLFDLQRGVDYEHSSDDLLFAFDLFNGQCWRKVHGKEEHVVPTLEIPRPLSAPTLEETYPGTASAPDYAPSPPEIYIPSSGPTGPGYLGPEAPTPYIPESGYKPSYDARPSLKPIYLPESGPGISGPSGPPGYPSSNFKPDYPTGPNYEPNPPSYIPDKYRPGGYRPSYRPDYSPSGPADGLKPSYGPSGSGYKPSYPSGSDFKPSYGPAYPPYEQDRPVYKPSYSPSGSGFKPHVPVGSGSYPGQDVGYRPQRPRPPPGDKIDQSLSVSWRHYTVSGFPCRKGTACEQNIIAGHWACEPEGGEIGSWDYCCAATHRCGYSEGFRKPWCYVGPSHDQWRPCSEKYYPYHQHNVPHPSQGHREAIHPRPDQNQNPIGRPSYVPADRDRFYPGGYLSEADRKYWDDLYKGGPQAYYDKHGNPMPGYTRVPIEDTPHIKYQRNPQRPGSGYWIPVSTSDDNEPPAAGGLGVPRYWPVAYLHKGPPPNMTYFRYNESTTTEKFNARPPKEQSDIQRINLDKPVENDIESRSMENAPRAEKRINITGEDDDIFEITNANNTSPTTSKPQTNETILKNVTEKEIAVNNTDTQSKPVVANIEEDDIIKGIDGKLHDFTKSIEVFDIEDVRGDRLSNFKTLEAEERQIEAIGRLVASRRGGKLVIRKRSQKDLESKSIALDKEFVDFNFGNKFPTSERRGVIQKVTKDDIEKNKFLNDKSLEVSETTFVRPPRVLSTTENVRKAIVNGKVFYDATIRDQRELYANSSRRAKSLRLEENRGPSVIPTVSAKKKNIRTRNTNPIRRVRRVYKKRYNPEEVRKRLLEREKNKNATDTIKS